MLLALLFACPPLAPAFAASDCAPVDLRPQLGAPRDQDDSGWCFAHTAADLLTQKTGVRVSAFDLALRSIAAIDALEQSPSRLVRRYLSAHPELGPVLEAARTLDRGTLSAEKLLSYREGVYTHGAIEDLSLLVANHEGLCEDQFFRDGREGFLGHAAEVERWVEANQTAPGRAIRRDISARARRLLSGMLDWTERRCGSRLEWARNIVPDSHYIAKNLREFRARFAQDRAGLRAEQAGLWREIDRALSEGRAVAVGFNAYEVEAELPDSLVSDGDHSMIVAAREPRGGACRYFLRDSVGATCHFFLDRHQANCEAAHGGVWVTPEQLQTLYSTVSYREASSREASGR